MKRVGKIKILLRGCLFYTPTANHIYIDTIHATSSIYIFNFKNMKKYVKKMYHVFQKSIRLRSIRFFENVPGFRYQVEFFIRLKVSEPDTFSKT